MEIKYRAPISYPPTPTFQVRFEIEVRASSPEQAAIIARDMLLDIDTRLDGDVHALKWHEEAEEALPVEDEGLSVYFGDRWPNHIISGPIDTYNCIPGLVDTVRWKRDR